MNQASPAALAAAQGWDVDKPKGVTDSATEPPDAEGVADREATKRPPAETRPHEAQPRAPPPPPDRVLMVPTSAVRERYGGVSDMWIDRRLRSDPSFPKPRYIGRRRYFLLAELEAWE